MNRLVLVSIAIAVLSFAAGSAWAQSPACGCTGGVCIVAVHAEIAPLAERPALRAAAAVASPVFWAWRHRPRVILSRRVRGGRGCGCH
jgi:hypothetical protein